MINYDNLTADFKEELKSLEKTNIRLGIDVEKFRNEYYYDRIIEYLKGDNSNCGSMYFSNLKPLYDKYGYEKVNRILLELDEEDKGDGENE